MPNPSRTVVNYHEIVVKPFLVFVVDDDNVAAVDVVVEVVALLRHCQFGHHRRTHECHRCC